MPRKNNLETALDLFQQLKIEEVQFEVQLEKNLEYEKAWTFYGSFCQKIANIFSLLKRSRTPYFINDPKPKIALLYEQCTIKVIHYLLPSQNVDYLNQLYDMSVSWIIYNRLSDEFRHARKCLKLELARLNMQNFVKQGRTTASAIQDEWKKQKTLTQQIQFLEAYEKRLEEVIRNEMFQKTENIFAANVIVAFTELHEHFLSFLKSQPHFEIVTNLKEIYQRSFEHTFLYLAQQKIASIYYFQLDQLIGLIDPFPDVKIRFACILKLETNMIKDSCSDFFEQGVFFSEQMEADYTNFDCVLGQAFVLLETGNPRAIINMAEKYAQQNRHYFNYVMNVFEFPSAKDKKRLQTLYEKYRYVVTNDYVKTSEYANDCNLASNIYALAKYINDNFLYFESTRSVELFFKIMTPIKEALDLLDIADYCISFQYLMMGQNYHLIKFTDREEEVRNEKRKALLEEKELNFKLPNEKVVMRKKQRTGSGQTKASSFSKKDQLLEICQHCELETLLTEPILLEGVLTARDILPILIAKGMTLNQFLTLSGQEEAKHFLDFQEYESLDLKYLLGIFHNMTILNPVITLTDMVKILKQHSIFIYQRLPLEKPLEEEALTELSFLSLKMPHVFPSVVSTLIETPTKLRIYLEALRQIDKLKYRLYHSALVYQEKLEQQDKIYRYYYKMR